MFNSTQAQYLGKVRSNLLVQRELACEYLDYVCQASPVETNLLVKRAIDSIKDLDERITQITQLITQFVN